MTITEAKDRARASSALQEARQAPPDPAAELLVEARGIHKVAGGSRSQTALHTQWLRDSLEPALTEEIPEPGGNGHQRVGGGLVREIIKLASSDVQPGPSPRLTPCHPKQELVQPRQRVVSVRAGACQRTYPLG